MSSGLWSSIVKYRRSYWQTLSHSYHEVHTYIWWGCGNKRTYVLLSKDIYSIFPTKWIFNQKYLFQKYIYTKVFSTCFDSSVCRCKYWIIVHIMKAFIVILILSCSYVIELKKLKNFKILIDRWISILPVNTPHWSIIL